MEKFVADTHAIIWYTENHPNLGKKARETLDLMQSGEAIIHVSIISFIEMDYLVRKNKINPKLPEILLKAAESSPDSALRICPVDFTIYKAFEKVPPQTIPDLPDRLIAATAFALKCPLITKDAKINDWDKLRTIW